MPRSDLEFWNRRSSAATILTNLRWTAVNIWAHARAPALGIVVIQILLGIQPALLIYVTQNLIDTVIAAAGRGSTGFGETLPWLVWFGLTLLLTNEVLWKIRDALHMRLEQNLEYALGRDFLAKGWRLPLIFFEVSESYDRLERARNSGRKLDRLFFNAMHVLQAGIKVVSVAAMFAPVSPWISLALLAVLVPQIRLETAQSQMFMAFTYGETEEGRRAGYVDRILTGRGEQKEMRLFALHGSLSERWKGMRQVLRERLLEQKQRQVFGGLPVSGLRIAVAVCVAVALAFFLRDRVLTPGRFVALFQGVNEMLHAGFSLAYHSRMLQRLSIEVAYVREFLGLAEGTDIRTRARQEDGEQFGDRPFPRPLGQGFAIDDVWFVYPAAGRDTSETGGMEGRSILRGVSFCLRPGEKVALVGENGAGKSTLAKILLGLYSPGAGRVVADGIGYDEIDPQSLTGAVSSAFQDFFNFELTLGQSIGVGAMGAGKGAQVSNLWPASLPLDPVLVEDAARRSGADAIAGRLPLGYDTPIGHILDGGRGLSGGEWQRIAVARAYTCDPELLILDEPTAALDPMAEAELYRQFSELLEGRTALLISHRLGSARMADRILVLKDGRIVEEGHHDDLLATGGVYAGMWEEQAAWYR